MNADKIIFEIDIQCPCSKVFHSIFYTHMFLYGKIPCAKNFLLANILGAKSQNISGVYSKNACKSYVEKYALRWNLLAIHNYAATAFIGDQYKTTENSENLWNDLSYCFSAEKSTLITKTKTKNAFEKKLDKDGVFTHNLKYGNTKDLHKDAFTFERSHAKFYAGILGDKTEILSGSFNFTNGPSTENIIYSKMDTNLFLENYLKPYKLEYQPTDKYQHFFYKSLGKRKFNDGYTISRKETIKRVLGE